MRGRWGDSEGVGGEGKWGGGRWGDGEGVGGEMVRG